MSLRKRTAHAAVIALVTAIAFVVPASPDQAVGTYNNAAIADRALGLVETQGGQCRAFVNAVIMHVSGGTQAPYTNNGSYFQSFINAGGVEIPNMADLAKGDVVQKGEFDAPGVQLHTWIIVGHVNATTYDVVDSNSQPTDPGRVRHYQRTFTLDSNTRAYRMGTVATTPTAPPSATGVVTRVGGNLYAWDSASSMSLVSSSATSGNWKVSGSRLVNLDSNGLWVKDGGNGWQHWSAPDVQEFQVSPTQVVTRVGSNLYSWSSASSMSLVSASASPGSWKLVGDRLVNLDANGLWVKDGSAGWQLWSAPDVQEFQVSPWQVVTRVGLNIYSWTSASSMTHVSGSATPGNWKLIDNRLANLDGNGLWAKDGANGWQQWSAPGVHEFQVSATQVVTRVGGNLYAWTSSSSMSLVSSSASAGNWKLVGDTLANLDSNGLWVKIGSGGWQSWSAPDVQEFHVR
jgi:hypothetical protein